MEVFKPLFLRADGAADGVAHSSVYPSSHCLCKSRQPETPLTPHHRPLPLYLSLLYEKPKGDPSLKINRFRSLSALLPFRCLSPWCSSFCRPGHDFRWNPQSRQSASKADPPPAHWSGVAGKRCGVDVFAFKNTLFPFTLLPTQKESATTC